MLKQIVLFLVILIGNSYGLFESEDSCTNANYKTILAESLLKMAHNFFKPSVYRDVKFFIYTKKNPKHSQEINRFSVKNSNFNPEHQTRILIHGYQESIRSCSMVLIRNAYLKKGDFNVIIVDWSRIASRLPGDDEKNLLIQISKLIVEFTNVLNTYDTIYLIGYSVGAHIAGLVGRRTGNKKFNTIYGLDPYGPGYYDENDYILKSGVANYVETIHTDMNKKGYRGKLGDASIYPDYGTSQNRCTFGEIIKHPLCEHNSAFYYFTDSIISTKCFITLKCDNFEQIEKNNCECNCNNTNCLLQYRMGGEPSQNKSGIFYINTVEANSCMKLIKSGKNDVAKYPYYKNIKNMNECRKKT